MNRTTRLLTPLVALSTLLLLAQAGAQPSFFAPLPRPDGITTDPAGNVWVVADATFARVLVIFAPDGLMLAQLPRPGTSIADTGTHNLLYDGVLGALWNLKSSGEVVLIDPNTGAASPLLNVKALPVDISAVYDVASQKIVPMGNSVPQASVYGDLACSGAGTCLTCSSAGARWCTPSWRVSASCGGISPRPGR